MDEKKVEKGRMRDCVSISVRYKAGVGYYCMNLSYIHTPLYICFNKKKKEKNKFTFVDNDTLCVRLTFSLVNKNFFIILFNDKKI